MDIDFASLAARIAADIQDLRGCVIVSRDGLVLGAYPTNAEATLRPAWLRFASLGDVEKGFVQFSGELWVYVRRGPYASFAVSNSVSRPGLILDELEQVLLTAEEARTASNQPFASAGGAPSSRPRTSLHPEQRPAQPTPTPAPVEATAEHAGAAMPVTDDPRVFQAAEAAPPPQAAPQAPPPQAAPQAPPPQAAPQAPPPQAAPQLPVPQLPVPPAADAPAQATPGDDTVDRVALAQEFAQLLGESGYDDEDS